MRPLAVIIFGIVALSMPLGSKAVAEPYHEYLSRLKDICSVECMQPRQFQRTARKRGSDSSKDMALIMDVAHVVRVGDRFELHNLNLESTHFDDLIDLQSAGVDISSRTGVGGLPRGRRNKDHPNLIVVELDAPTVRDLLAATTLGSGREASDTKDDGTDILVEGDRDKELELPSVVELTNLLRNRRIVVRGTPKLEVTLIGGRRDFRRKQVTLLVDDTAHFAILPRFEEFD